MRIGIIGAMNEEVHLLQDALEHSKIIKRAGVTFYKGTLFNQSVVVCKSGVGKVNAAMATQLLISEFAVSSILFTGVAGALDPSLQIGDIVISSHLQQHDMDATSLGFPLGVIPFFDRHVFQANPTLIDRALQASSAMYNGTIKVGCIVSGDQFIGNPDKAEELHKHFDALCAEMEGAAVAQVCQSNAIPFVIIRSMSDKADGSAPANFAEFVRFASDRSFNIVKTMLKHN